jgi:hypothetical protein
MLHQQQRQPAYQQQRQPATVPGILGNINVERLAMILSKTQKQ